MSRSRSPIEIMIDQACGYNPDAPIIFTPEQEQTLKALSEEDPGRFAVGIGAAQGYINWDKTPNTKVPETLIDFMREFMSNEPLDEKDFE